MSSPSADFEREMERLMFGGVAALYPGLQIYTPNRKWIEPKDAFYFSFHISSGSAFNSNIGGNKWERIPVVLTVMAYCPTEIADRQSLDMAETAARFFAQQNVYVAPGHKSTFGPPTITSSPDPKTNKHRTIAKITGWRDCLVTPPGDTVCP